MRIAGTLAIAITLVGGSWAFEQLNAQVSDDIVVLDNCLPGDPGWTPTGGCAPNFNPLGGDVSVAEFNLFLTSPLSSGLIGHPSWRNEPAHIRTAQTTIRVRNAGGRAHTFTRVTNFGGGSVAGFNVGLTRAPECPATVPAITDLLPPGAPQRLDNLPKGLNKFMCCLHPWMRATVLVD